MRSASRSDPCEPRVVTGPMRLAVGALFAIVLAALLVAGAPPARAAEDPHFERYWLTAHAHPEGTIDVEIDIDYDFDDVPSHGIFLSYYTRQEIEEAPEQLRELRFSDVEVTSSTGASTELQTTEEDGQFLIHIGEPDTADLTGLHSYRVSFAVDGIINPSAGANGEDEIYWNVIGAEFQERIQDARVELSAPSAPLRGQCVAGLAITLDCDTTQKMGDRAVFTHTDLGPSEYLTIATQYEPGTFPGAEIYTARKAGLGDRSVRQTAIIGALAAAALIAAVLRFRDRDRAYRGVPPGVIPKNQETARVGRVPLWERIPVRNEPPEKCGPMHVVMLMNKRSRLRDLPLTLVDFAARGLISIDVDPDSRQWTFQRRKTGARVRNGHEKRVFAIVTKGGHSPVRIEDLDTKEKAELGAEPVKLGEEVVSEGLFTRSPVELRHKRQMYIDVAFVTTVFGTLIGYQFGLGWLGLIPGGAALGFFIASRSPGARTAKGRALCVQTKGFRAYLSTVRANSLQGKDVAEAFSQYLPYAVALGVERRWRKRFKDLVARGELALPSEPIPGMARRLFAFNLRKLISRFDFNPSTLTELAKAAAAASPGSAGASGFRGIFAGGGVGGGGGGRW